jgi:hypothetical protein
MDPQWAPDPFGRFTFRWWDGHQWTEHVLSGTTARVDPPNDTPPTRGGAARRSAATLVDVALGRRGWRAGLAGWGSAVVTVGVIVTLGQPKPAPISTFAYPGGASARATHSPIATAHVTSSPTEKRTAAVTSATTAKPGTTTKPGTGPTSTSKKSVPATTKPNSARHVTNCGAMREVYPHGVGRPGAIDHTKGTRPVTDFVSDRALYAANQGSDRDRDGIACEQL